MAALLRSARLLKFSPSGLLHIPGTRRSGPLLGRLYSGAVGGRTAICSRQISHASDSVTRCVWPYAAGCVRSYAVASEQKNEASVAVQSKQAMQFDWALNKLDNSVRKTGRVSKTLLLRILHDTCRAGYPSGNQALLLLRSCGSLLPEVPLEERTELAHRVWDKLQELGAQYDVSHYNALLKVYLQNDFKFSPIDFLAKMETANIQPNRVTYQRLITAYCQNGDIEGASTILGYMKNKALPITEAVFSSLVTGHARAGDLDSAANILPVMRGAGIEPSLDTYMSLLNAYAEKGDLDNMKKTLEEAESNDCILMDREIMLVIYTLAKAGQHQHIPEMMERLRHDRGFISDAMNLCLNLITQGQEDTAFRVLKTFPVLDSDEDSMNTGRFFLKHCINNNTPLEKIVRYCNELQEMKLHIAPLSFTLLCSLRANKIDTSLELMELLKEQNFPIRHHYFWPLFTHALKENNIAGVMEVLKGMQKLGVSPDSDTLSRYVFPAFPNMETAHQALKNAGVFLDSEDKLSIEVRLLAITDLAKLYTTLSDPSFPHLNIMTFRGCLCSGFRKSSDVQSMVKIFELLYKDERFCNATLTPVDSASYFLYNLINTTKSEQLQAQETTLRNFFNQLQTQNITIPFNICKGIKRILLSHDSPDLVKDVMALAEPNGETPQDFELAGSDATAHENVFALEKKMAKLKAENKPYGIVLKQAIIALSDEEDLQHALELKQQHESEMTDAAYASLISLCCIHGNVEEALNLKREMSRKNSSFLLDSNKYLRLVKLLALNDKVEEAVDILKEMKEKGLVLNDFNLNTIFHMLNALTLKGNMTTFRRLLDTIITLGLAKPTANLCSPMVLIHLNSNDLSGALEAAMECQKLYNRIPRIHDITVALVEKGDSDLLQKAMDFVSQEQGEMNMLYCLFFAFLQTGRYREARKIIETPGLRAKSGRFQWFAEKCISNNRMEVLEKMVEVTAKLFESDRDEMYSYIFRLCKETNDWQRAEATWTKMQEENVIPRERTLLLLADILKSNGQEVPFDVPESWYNQETDTAQQVMPQPDPPKAEDGVDYKNNLLTLCKKGNTKEAFLMMKEADQKGVRLSIVTYDVLIRALLAEGSIEDAFAVVEIAKSHIPNYKLSNTANSLLIVSYTVKGQVKEAMEELRSMIQSDSVPSTLAIAKLVQALGQNGNVADIQELESLIKQLGKPPDMSNMVFVNNLALSHINNGDYDSAVELLEGVYTNPLTSRSSTSYVFRNLLESGNDEALDKLSAMAERLANHFSCFTPASHLFLQLLEKNKVEEAKQLLARCPGVAEQRDLFISFVSRKAKKPGQVEKIKNLMSLIPDFVEKDALYFYLLKAHAQDKDLTSAKAVYEQMMKDGIAVDELSLKRLAFLYRQAGEEVPFTEPPESFTFYSNKLKEKTAKDKAEAEE